LRNACFVSMYIAPVSRLIQCPAIPRTIRENTSTVAMNTRLDIDHIGDQLELTKRCSAEGVKESHWRGVEGRRKMDTSARVRLDFIGCVRPWQKIRGNGRQSELRVPLDLDVTGASLNRAVLTLTTVPRFNHGTEAQRSSQSSLLAIRRRDSLGKHVQLVSCTGSLCPTATAPNIASSGIALSRRKYSVICRGRCRVALSFSVSVLPKGEKISISV
jgi:hypothetical protein